MFHTTTLIEKRNLDSIHTIKQHGEWRLHFFSDCTSVQLPPAGRKCTTLYLPRLCFVWIREQNIADPFLHRDCALQKISLHDRRPSRKRFWPQPRQWSNDVGCNIHPNGWGKHWTVTMLIPVVLPSFTCRRDNYRMFQMYCPSRHGDEQVCWDHPAVHMFVILDAQVICCMIKRTCSLILDRTEQTVTVAGFFIWWYIWCIVSQRPLITSPSLLW